MTVSIELREALQVPSAPWSWREQLKRLGRFVRLSVYAVLGIATVSLVCRYVGIWNLPDVGDPFDVAEFRASKNFPKANEAMSLYRQAAAAYQPLKMLGRRPGPGFAGPHFQGAAFGEPPFDTGWATAHPGLKSWVEKNRPALRLWRSATERSEAHAYWSGDPKTARSPLHSDELHAFVLMAQLEAARHQEAGEQAEAWAWHRASLRCLRQIGIFDPINSRPTLESSYHPWICREVDRWASNPNVNSALLRQALKDVLAIDEIDGNDADAFKSEYVNVLRQIDDPPVELSERIEKRLLNDLSYGHVAVDSPTEGIGLSSAGKSIKVLKGFTLHEPERSRRVARLIFTNFLKNADTFADGEGVFLEGPGWNPMPVLLTNAKQSEPTPGGLNIAEITEWYESTIYLRELSPMLPWYVRGTVQRSVNQGTLTMALATQLYRREHAGQEPPSPTELVAPYTKALPARFVNALLAGADSL